MPQCTSRCGLRGGTSTLCLTWYVRPVTRAACIFSLLPGPDRPAPSGCPAARSLIPILVPVRSGLLGGTFDPPHIAHLLAGEVAYRQLGLDQIIFLPAGSPWQKADRKISAAHHRWNMTDIATASVPYFVPDDQEVHRDGWTYTVDTLATFHLAEEIVLILGADAARGLPTWERADEVLKRVQVAVLPRPGTERSEVDAAVGDPIWLDMPALPVSGTLIRERFAAGTGVRFLVTDGVYEYMVENRLYEDSPPD